jgi:hypothetical protein
MATNKDHISIDTSAKLGTLEFAATDDIRNEIVRTAEDMPHPRTIAELARTIGVESRKLSRWLDKLGINIHRI